MDSVIRTISSASSLAKSRKFKEAVDVDGTSITTGDVDGEEEFSNYSEYISSDESDCGRDSVCRSRANTLSICPGNVHSFYDMDVAELDDLTYRSVVKANPKGGTGLPPRCVKAISKSQVVYPEHLYSEVAITQMLDHPNVMDRYECFEDETFIYLVTELCEGGELFEHVAEHGSLGEDEAAAVAQQVFKAVAYIHSRGVVHRDLTCENVFLRSRGPLQEAQVKVTGFDRATSGRQVEDAVRAGSSPYAAPEVHNNMCDKASDCWSCGCILFVLLGGFHPFVGRNDRATMSKIRRGSYSFKGDQWDLVSQNPKDLIEKLLRTNPKERITAKQALSHPWLSGVPRSTSI